VPNTDLISPAVYGNHVAWHEAGHALAADLCPTHPKVQRMTILARGMAAGLALFGDTGSAMLSPQELHERMIVALAGRAAEQVHFGTISSGAANDLEQVNRPARQAVERLGFAPQVGQIVTSVGEMPLTLAESTGREIDLAVGAMVDAAYAEALTLLDEHGTQLDRLATAVLEHEQLDREAPSEVLWEIQHPGQRRVPAQVKALPTDRTVLPVATRADPAPPAGTPDRDRLNRLDADGLTTVGVHRHARRWLLESCRTDRASTGPPGRSRTSGCLHRSPLGRRGQTLRRSSCRA
jgi:Peptidase family M41